MAPFVSAQTPEVIGRKLFRDILPENNLNNIVIPQILGNNPEAIAGTANAMLDIGFEEVNLNLGCPYPMVTKKNRGAGLLRDVDALDRLLDDVFSKIKIRLSIKTRIGFESPDEIIRLMEIFNRYPASEIIVHPRVARQMYSGKASIDAFIKLMGICKHRLVYNGDICSPDFFKGLEEKLPGIDRWMIGRGAISNPFLPEMIRSSGDFPEDSVERFFNFHDDLYCAYKEKFHGPAHLIDRMKAFWRYFGISLKDGKDICKKINKTKTENSYNSAIEQIKNNNLTFVAINSPLQLK